MRSGGTPILTEATWFHDWSASTAPASWTSMDLSLGYQLRSEAWLHLLTEATAWPPVTPDFSGEVRFAQCRQSHPDRSNLVSSMVYGSDAGSLDFDGLEFGLTCWQKRPRCLPSGLLLRSSLIVVIVLPDLVSAFWLLWRDFTLERTSRHV